VGTKFSLHSGIDYSQWSIWNNIMPVLICDPDIASEFESQREANGLDKYDEVWDGVIVVTSPPNIEHQQLVSGFVFAIQSAFGWPSVHQVLPGANVSDRDVDWKSNYREPDVVVYCDGNPAVNCGTHWNGGPDFLVEIVSPGDPTRDKLPFYASVNSREVLIVDRYPWRLELYRLQNGQMLKVGQSDLNQPNILQSSVLPVSFRLVAGSARPQIELTHSASGQAWRF
jgi:Uma2 family endonuclease